MSHVSAPVVAALGMLVAAMAAVGLERVAAATQSGDPPDPPDPPYAFEAPDAPDPSDAFEAPDAPDLTDAPRAPDAPDDRDAGRAARDEHVPAFCRGLTDSTDLGISRDMRAAGGHTAWRLCRPVDDGAVVRRYEVGVVDVAEERLDGFRRLVTSTLASPLGWSAYGTGVRLERAEQHADFRVVLASPEAVKAAHAGCSADYSCRVGDTIWVNERRWDEGVASYREAEASLLDYRRMVINHEVGHALGLDHEECPGEAEPAPVMQQQSMGLDGCDPNSWPLPHERDRAAP